MARVTARWRCSITALVAATFSASSGRWGWPSFVAEQALLAALGKPVLYSPGMADFFSGNAGNQHDLILGELRKSLNQHRQHNRFQIRPSGQNLLTAGCQFAFRPHRQGQQVQQRIEVGLLGRGPLPWKGLLLSRAGASGLGRGRFGKPGNTSGRCSLATACRPI